jgi:hypothetical protein
MLVCRRWRVAFDCSTTCRIGEKFAAPSRNADLVIEACSGRLPAAKGRLWHPVAFLRIARGAGFKFLHATHQLRHIPLYVERMQGFIDYGVTTPFKPMLCVFVVGRGNLDVVLPTLAPVKSQAGGRQHAFASALNASVSQSSSAAVLVDKAIDCRPCPLVVVV